MASPLANAQRSGGLVYMPPARPAPTRRTNAAPPRRRSASPPSGQVDWLKVRQAYASTPEAQQKRAEEEQDQQGGFWNSDLGRGLGIVLGNPVSKAALSPLSAFALPGRAVVAGIEEGVKALPEDWERKLEMLTRQTPGAINAIDEDRNEGRSVMDRVMDPTYGFGSTLQETDNKWANRAVGLTGDIVFDPLTYIGGAGNRALMASAPRAAAGREAAGLAERLAPLAGQGGYAGAARQGIERQLAEAQAKVARLPTLETRVPTGRAARAEFLSRLSLTDPEALAALAPDIARAGERGLNVASPALREATGLQEPAFRLFDAPIPGTRKLAQGIAGVTGLGRTGLNKIPGADVLARGPKGLEDAMATLTRGQQQMDVPRAAAQVQLANLARQGEGTVRSMGRGMMRNFFNENVKGKSRESVDELVKAAEATATKNPVNDLFAQLKDLFEQVTGTKLTAVLPGEVYVPHMLTPSFRRLLNTKGDADEAVRQFKKEAGIVTDDLLESSSFLERARKLRPNPNGSPRTIKIAGREIIISTGTLDELNRELTKVFPGFKGKFYEQDPLRMAESYVDSIARQAGRDVATRRFADSANNMVQRVEGPLAQALDERNRVLRTQGAHVNAAMAGPKYTPGQAAPKIAPVEELPDEVAGINLKDFFASRTDKPATRARREFLTSSGARKYQRAAEQDVRDTRKAASKEIYSLRDRMRKDLVGESAILTRDLRPLDANIEAMRHRLGQLKPAREQYHQELTAMMIAAKTHIADIEDEIVKLNRVFKGRTTREVNAVERKLRGMLDTLRQIEKRAEDAFKLGPAKLREEAEGRLNALMRPVDEAREILKQAEKQIKRPVVGGRVVDDAAVAWAEETLKRKFTRATDPTLLRKTEAHAKRVIKTTEGRMAKGQIVGERGRIQYENAVKQLAQVEERRNLLNAAQQIESEWAELKSLRQTVGKTGANRGKDAEGVARRNVLEAKFKRGGEYGIRVRQAYEIIDADKAWRIKTDQWLEPLRKNVSDAEYQVQRQQEALIFVMEGGQERRVLDMPGRPIQGLGAGQTRRAKQVELPEDLGQAYVNAGWDPRKQQAVPYAPRTEEQAIADLKNRASQTAAQLSPKVREARFARESTEQRLSNMVRGEPDFEQIDVAERMAVEREGEVFPLAVEKMDAEMERDLGLASQRKLLRQIDEETTNTQYKLQQDLKDQKRMVEARRKTTTLIKNLDKTKGRGKAELDNTLNEIEAVAKQNPLLDDAGLTEAESLLNTHREALERVRATDIHAQEMNRMIEDAFRGRVPKVSISILNDQWKQMHRGAVQRGDVIMEAELARRFKNIYEISREPKMFGRVFNAATNVFKTYATLSPGFHVRNALSAIFMNSSDGVALATQLEGWRLWQRYMKGGDKWLRTQPDEIQQAFRASFASGAGGRFTESGVADMAESRVLNAVMNNRATRFSQRTGERVEGGVRLGMALDSIRAGEDAATALQRITRIHFDYGQVSALDEQAKRLIPFWTFMSRNLPMQVTQMWTKPKLYNRYQQVINNFSEDSEDYTPAYWLKAGAWNTGMTAPDVTGGEDLPVYLSPDLGFTRLNSDLTDYEDFLSGDRPGGVLSNFNPLITAPAEFITKQDIFTGRKFDENDFEEVGGIMTPVQIMASLLGQTNEKGQVSSNFLNAVRSVNPLMDRSARIAPQITGGNEEAVRRQPESIARFLGVPVRTLTPQQQRSEYLRQAFERQSEEARLRAMLQVAQQS